ncbi:hypothetical protein SUGI_0937610 [Cryptomeria japonica]|nr:hypothetical protein SUGI_0937610 [Cryptomeria japonica]
MYRCLNNNIRSRRVTCFGSPSVKVDEGLINLEGILAFRGALPLHLEFGRRSHMGHTHHHDHPEGIADGEAGVRVSKLGLAADVALAGGKTMAGYLSGSTAIIADAAHSISDVVLSGVALWSFKAARVPKDKEHPYGHGKFETVGALGISLMLLATGGGIAWHAVDVLQGLLNSSSHLDMHSLMHTHGSNHAHGGHHHGIDMEHPILALNTAIISIGVKEGLYWVTKRAGEKIGSGLLKANAWHHRADAVSSVIALVGVGGRVLGVPFLDPLAGILVSGMIVKAGLQNGYQSMLELVDVGAPESLLAPFRQTVLQVEGVKGCHHLRGRKAGSLVHLDIHIEVDPFLSVSAAHNIGETVRHELHERHSEVAEVFIHIDPSHLENCLARQGARNNIIEESKQNNSLMTSTQQLETEKTVHNVLSTKFSETMTVEHVTSHFLQGKVFVQVQISILADILIRDAMAIALDAEKEILQASSEISSVNILLRLGPQLKEAQLQSNL